MPSCDQFKYKIESEGQFVGYGCDICRQLGKTFEVKSSGYRGCGESCSGGLSKHIYAKHKDVLERGFILFCKDCDLYKWTCHEPHKGMNPQNCPHFKRLEEARKQ
jgi:hypothetical protein